jgi:hypothetical protein
MRAESTSMQAIVATGFAASPSPELDHEGGFTRRICRRRPVTRVQSILEVTTECNGWAHAMRARTLLTSASPTSAMRT